MSAILALGVFLSLGTAAAPPEPEPEPPAGFRLSDLSGTWVGTHTVEQVGQCRGPGESAVILTLDVGDDGRIEVKAGGPRLGVGTVSAETWKFTLQQETFARCGHEERRYQRERTGTFRREGDGFMLELQGEDAPCPPRCVFNDRYLVKKQDLDALMRAAARDTGGAGGPTAPRAVPDVPARPAARGTAEADDQVRLAAILKAIEEAAARKNPNTPFAPLAYCIAVDGTRDHGDPESPSGAMPDDDLFMQGPREEPSAGLMRDVRSVHPLARTWADCPEFEGRGADWWQAPVHVVVRRLFWLEDGSVKVPVMRARPHSGCYGFVFYHVRRAEDRWTLTVPDYRHSLCH